MYVERPISASVAWWKSMGPFMVSHFIENMTFLLTDPVLNIRIVQQDDSSGHDNSKTNDRVDVVKLLNADTKPGSYGPIFCSTL